MLKFLEMLKLWDVEGLQVRRGGGVMRATPLRRHVEWQRDFAPKGKERYLEAYFAHRRTWRPSTSPTSRILTSPRTWPSVPNGGFQNCLDIDFMKFPIHRDWRILPDIYFLHDFSRAIPKNAVQSRKRVRFSDSAWKLWPPIFLNVFTFL